MNREIFLDESEGVPETSIEQEKHTLEERYQKELLPLITIVKPEDIPIEEYEAHIVNDLYEDVRKIQVGRGISVEDPEQTFAQQKEMFTSRIKALVEDYNSDPSKRESMDLGLVRRAKIALLYEKDFSGLEKYHGKEWRNEPSNPYEYSLNDLRGYLTYYREEHKLTESELEGLMQAGFGKGLADSSYYDFASYIETVPESLLVELAHSKEYSRSIPIEFALDAGSSKEKYSETAAKELIANSYGKYVLNHFDKFKEVDFQDAVIGYGPSSPYYIPEMVKVLRTMNLPEDEFKKNLDTIIQHQKITDGVWSMPQVEEYYNDVTLIKDLFGWKSAASDETKIRGAKGIIERGNVGFLYNGREPFVEHLAKNEYDWLLEQVKKYDQEHLLMGHQNLLKAEDQLDYAKKLLSDKKDHLLASMIIGEKGNSGVEVFQKHALDQEVYDALVGTFEGREIPLTLFKNLREDIIETLPSDPGIDEVLSFDLEYTERYKDHKNFQETIGLVETLFGKGKAQELAKALQLEYARFKGSDLVPIQEAITKKAEIMHSYLPFLYPDTLPNEQIDLFGKQYVNLLTETPEEMEELLSQTQYFPRNVIKNEELYIEGLKTLRALPDAVKGSFLEDVQAIRKVSSCEQLFERYFTMTKGEQYTGGLETFIPLIPEYVATYKKMDKEEKEFWQKLLPWSESLEKIEGLQKQVSRAEYDPWHTHFIPLLKDVCEREMSLASPEDGKIMAEYVDRFGMKNLPLIFGLYLDIRRSPDVDHITTARKGTLKTHLGIDVDELAKKDKKNIGLILSQLEKVVPNTIRSFREEDMTLVSGLIESPYKMEIFKSIVGSSGHGHGGEIEDVLQSFQETMHTAPEKFALPEGYQEVVLEIPELVVTEEEKSEKILQEKNKVQTNPDLLATIGGYRKVVEGAEAADNTRWMEERGAEVTTFFSEAVRDMNIRLTEEQQAETPNEKALFGLQKRIEQYEKNQLLFEEQFPSVIQSKEMIIKKIESVFAIIPDDYAGKKEMLMRLTLRDIAHKEPEAYAALVSAHESDSLAVEGYHEFIANHVREHYLNKKHGLEASIETDNKDLIKVLRKHWGTQDFEKSILAISNEKLKTLDKGELTGKIKVISLVPSKGLQRIFSGDIGKACTSRQNHLLAKGEFEDIISYSIVLDKETNNERFAGSFLIIETKTEKGEPALVVRANNPQQNLFNMVDGNTLITSILDEVKNLAERRGIKTVVVPLSGGATSNRTEVANYYIKAFKNNNAVQLENTIDTNFNGYDIWNAEKGNAVVSIN